ncbi:hypothetical protein NC653_033903 [Populus alba x Populus x berolinensis]|uniref:Secreted protein n=1 Tax=Populus alba x Populus x berolinensis TaxID=444605 RepID=A0AAD6PZM8_9ROSI|nr:hypothetical protein NC653_033903 [Populus alba x Populus x berolinensis]
MFTDGLVLFLKLSFVVLALRSGLEWKHSIDVGVGVIDVDYRGLVWLILEKIVTPNVMQIEDLDATERGVGEFRSIGV